MTAPWMKTIGGPSGGPATSQPVGIAYGPPGAGATATAASDVESRWTRNAATRIVTPPIAWSGPTGSLSKTAASATPNPRSASITSPVRITPHAPRRAAARRDYRGATEKGKSSSAGRGKSKPKKRYESRGRAGGARAAERFAAPPGPRRGPRAGPPPAANDPRPPRPAPADP